MLYCFMYPHCQRVECCLTIDVDGFEPTFRLFMELRPCDFSFVVGFEEETVYVKLDEIPSSGK